MKILALFGILISIIFLNCSSQRNITTKKSKQEFLQWIIEQQSEKQIYKQPIELSIEKFWKLKAHANFSKEDSIELQSQIELNNKTAIDVKLPSNKTFITDVENEDTYLKITNPIFFDDGKKVWIYMQHHSAGKSGSETVEVYEVNDKRYKRHSGMFIWDRGE